MDLFLACVLIAASFLCVLFGSIARKNSVSILLMLVWIALWETSRRIASLAQFEGFFFATMIPALVVRHIVNRRRVMPPCIRVNSFYRGFLIVVVSLLVVFFWVLGFFGRLGTISEMLKVATLTFMLVYVLWQRTEICGNGIWEWGAIHAWDEYEYFLWTGTDNGAIAELKVREGFREPFGPRLFRLTIQREGSAAAKQLLQANLINRASDE
jgi:hypothetical protein